MSKTVKVQCLECKGIFDLPLSLIRDTDLGVVELNATELQPCPFCKTEEYVINAGGNESVAQG